MYSLLKFIFGLLALIFILAFARTWQMEHGKNQARFKAGDIPNPLPSGLYAGTVSGRTYVWRGKKFDMAKATGINVFGGTTELTQTEKYPFIVVIDKGIRDTDMKVVKINYNLPENPWWLRMVLDEIVEIEPNHYLGKLHVRFGNLVWTLSYFELKK
jgi:hypothetical protein